MYSRVTLLEIDTLRTSVEEAVELFKREVVPQLKEQAGYVGVVVLATPEGRGMIITVWETEAAAAQAAAFAAGVVERYVTLYRSPPGREYYEVAFAEMPAATVG